MLRVYLTVVASLLAAGTTTFGGDVDLDGVDDAVDVCCNTPLDTVVDSEGRPIGDLDGDCDNDLLDYVIFLSGHTGIIPPSGNPDGDPCDDGDPCTFDDRYACQVCAGTPYVCNDAIACTIDVCLGDGSCRHEVAAGECLIDGSCHAPGDGPAAWPCVGCYPSFSQISWAPRPGGYTCDDNNACTIDDVCNGSGICFGDPFECEHDPACESATCTPGSGCNITLNAGWCRIDDTCVAHDELNPLNECLVCLADHPDDWSHSSERCDDGDDCTHDDTCDGGVCVGVPYSCNDGKICTLDSCDGRGGCENVIHEAACLIQDTCRANGASKPTNDCLFCVASVSQTLWTPAPLGWSCNDGLVCTSNDACDGAGRCVGDLSGCPAMQCEKPVCNAEGGCDVELKPGWCRIAGVCYVHGTLNPADECQVCDDSAPEVWTDKSGGGCADGDYCTHSDECLGGVCVGTPYSCDDGFACTLDACTGDGRCQYRIAPDACFIDDWCWPDGKHHPSQYCLHCDAANPLEWSNLAESCEDGDPCTYADQCADGVCIGGPRYSCDDGISCTEDNCGGAGGCEHPIYSSACLIDGRCYPVDRNNPDNDCEYCAPGVQTEWSFRPDGTDCEGNMQFVIYECNGHGECLPW